MPKIKEDANTPRRGGRMKKMSLKAVESLEGKQEIIVSEESDDSIASIHDAVSTGALPASGKDIFSFQGKKKLSRLVFDTSEKEKVTSVYPKTPHKVRKKIKKGIATVLDFSSSDEDPYSPSGSEYSASGASSSESEASAQTSNEEDSENEMPSSKQIKCPQEQGAVPNTPHKTKKGSKQQKYSIKTDEYFSNQALKKLTSNHTLDKLKTPRLSQDQLQKLMEKLTLSKSHERAVAEFAENNRAHFTKWMYLLHENFNLLLYGLGSKRSILQQFHNDFLSDLPVVVVNGFFPSLTLKDILDAIVVDVLELSERPSNPFESCDLIAQEFALIPQIHLYLIVHNIDGDMLRNAKSQGVLSKLATIRNVHLIASIDHINAPLIWDHNKLSKFNFAWWDVTSFLPYFDETSFESSMMVQRTGNLALSSLRNVFLSLTTNSKGIYLTIVRYQLENQSHQYYQGLLFKDLYCACRESFLVSSDLALRAQLTEFVDHKMVRFKRSMDGAEYLIIPIQNALLQQFLNEQKK